MTTIYRLAFVLALATGCADIATSVNVAPSAHHRMADIADGVELMNGLAGVTVFDAIAVNSEDRVDDQIIMRTRELEPHTDGYAQRTPRGVVVTLDVGCDVKCIAHELGHAAGLKHVNDPENLMHTKANGARLEAWQVDVIRRLSGEAPAERASQPAKVNAKTHAQLPARKTTNRANDL